MPPFHNKIYGDKLNGYAYDPVTSGRLRPSNIYKVKCGHHLTKATFNKMVKKSPKSFNVGYQKYTLQCPICREVIYVCNW